MSGFDTDFAATSRESLLARFGDTYTYTPVNGVGVSVEAIEGTVNDSNDREQITLQISVAAVASPAANATMQKGSEKAWEVDRVGDPSGGMVTLECSRERTGAHGGV